MSDPVVVQHAPHLDRDQALEIASTLYNLTGIAEELASERDQNFRIVSPNGEVFVLKVANATEGPETLDFQNAAIEHLAARGLPGVPRLVRTLDGRPLGVVTADDKRHFVRLITWVPGVPLAGVKPHSGELLVELGRAIGRMDDAFRGFEHPVMHREFPWDLTRTVETVEQGFSPASQSTATVEQDASAAPVLRTAQGLSPALQLQLQRVVDDFQRRVVPKLGTLRRHVIHNDANDYNVIVSHKASGLGLPADQGLRPSGQDASDEGAVTREPSGVSRVSVIDFGDMVHSIVVADLAVACAYAMLDKPDPVGAAAAVVSGYHEAHRLTEDEIAVLFDLVRARLAVSVAMAWRQTAEAPDNRYLQISQEQVRALIERLDDVPAAWAHAAFRAACGLPPFPASRAVRAWLAANRDTFGPILPVDLRTSPVTAVDLSVGSLDIPRFEIIEDKRAMLDHVAGLLEKAGGRVGVGGYGEARLIYVTGIFRHANNWSEESRTIHLGIDLFADAGTRVFAPLAGKVHSFGNNADAGDYGPTIILEHDVGDGLRFFTLYGHLAAASLEGLQVGAHIERGETLARLGEPAVNGGWPPHLHFQVMVDTLGLRGNFPGVAAPGEREIWLDLCPDPNLVLGIPEERLPAPQKDAPAILRSRAAHLGPNLSVSYRRPLTIVRGHRQYLFDSEGRRFLDAVNNVPHVGHSHPRVVSAVARQLSVLTTNTRYLHPLLADYIERLSSLLPPPLEVVFVVSSGSEANELALRLAHTRTGRRGIVVLDSAYHGNTTSLVEISPYKFDGPGGEGRPPHVRKVPFTVDRSSVEQGLSRALQDLSASPFGLAAFFHESLLSCAGQVVLPDGYLSSAYRGVRAAGGVCVADEVQVGFGRVGTHFWGFETQGVVPDIVTMGKPIGNGFPLGAVATTREIADAFANGMEYFSTFGGSPAACAAGLAVLDVMRDEGLQRHALKVGSRLKAALTELDRFPIVGHVRGLGLFLGVELVLDRETMTPATRQADYIVNRMRDRGILLSTDGPYHNVIKIKPPMCFTSQDADRLAETLAQVLEEDASQV